MSFEQVITTGNFIGPFLSSTVPIVVGYIAWYFQNKSARERATAALLKPIEDKLEELKVSDGNFVPEDVIEARFKGLEAAQLLLSMDTKELKDQQVVMRERMAKVETSVENVYGMVNEIKDQLKEQMRMLQDIQRNTRRDH